MSDDDRPVSDQAPAYYMRRSSPLIEQSYKVTVLLPGWTDDDGNHRPTRNAVQKGCDAIFALPAIEQVADGFRLALPVVKVEVLP